jgi:hypothetical protein
MISAYLEGRLDGVTVYVATPSTDYPKDKVVLFLPDAMGLQAVNSQVPTALALHVANRPTHRRVVARGRFRREWFQGLPLPCFIPFVTLLTAHQTVIVDYYAGDPVPEGAFELMVCSSPSV